MTGWEIPSGPEKEVIWLGRPRFDARHPMRPSVEANTTLPLPSLPNSGYTRRIVAQGSLL